MHLFLRHLPVKYSPSDELGNSTSPFLFLQFELPPNTLSPLAAGSPEVQVGLQGSDFSGSPTTSVQASIPGQRAWRAQLPAWGLDLRGPAWKVSQEGGGVAAWCWLTTTWPCSTSLLAAGSRGHLEELWRRLRAAGSSLDCSLGFIQSREALGRVKMGA